MGATEKVEIVPYRDEWPTQFLLVKNLLASTLPDLFFSIDHIGSTSVPNLRAKDRIDVQMTVKDLTAEFKHILDARLVEGGFAPSQFNRDHRPPGDRSLEAEWAKLYIRGAHASLSFNANIHVRVFGSRNWRYPLLFRDYLRAHPISAETYARAKEKLARYLGDDRDAYSDAKDPICDLIMVAAEQWREHVQWKPKLSVDSESDTA